MVTQIICICPLHRTSSSDVVDVWVRDRCTSADHACRARQSTDGGLWPHLGRDVGICSSAIRKTFNDTKRMYANPKQNKHDIARRCDLDYYFPMLIVY